MSERKRREIQNRTRLTAYMWQMQNQLFAMFRYRNIPFRKEFLEWELMRTGFVAIAKIKNKIYVGSLSGIEFDEYGLPKEGSKAEFHTRYGRLGANVTIGKNCVIGYNNPVRTPELFIPYYAELFNEIDTSIKTNVLTSRCASVPMAKDDKTKVALENIFSEIKEGNPKPIASTNILEDILDGEGKEPVTMLHLTQPEQIERVQYLSKLYDDLQRRFWNNYGHSMNSTGKMAQVSEMELEGYETYSMITPFTMLESRQELIELCNTTFGTDWCVDFSDAWQHLNDNPRADKPKEEEPKEEEPKDEESEVLDDET